jgi:hypothetical protein
MGARTFGIVFRDMRSFSAAVAAHHEQGEMCFLNWRLIHAPFVIVVQWLQNVFATIAQ